LNQLNVSDRLSDACDGQMVDANDVDQK
jgi:hypothetical protein